ncbi:class I SAM-dependent methyltransferase [Bacillus sp. NPDC077027]|uniref:class I SAM-dependent methyltransferase n=1 Tax=Bacillus sp. NPDC077027 TaxID=3390548 RepID=UPI003D00F6AD
MMSDYVNMLAYFGVSSAHPGGFELTKTLIEHAKLSPKQRILDVGCGTGQTAAYLGNLGFQVEAIDVHPLMVEKANHRFQLEDLPLKAIESSIEKTHFKNDTFSTIISESVLSFTNIPRALAEMKRLLSPGGKLLANEAVVKAPLSLKEMETIKQFYGFSGIYSTCEWEDMLKDSGFKDVQILSFDEHMVQEEPTEMDLSLHIPPSLYNTLQTHYDFIQTHRQHLSHFLFECTV